MEGMKAKDIGQVGRKIVQKLADHCERYFAATGIAVCMK